jgi:hypothetical protein
MFSWMNGALLTAGDESERLCKAMKNISTFNQEVL